jgi:hypothetical protein
MPARARLVFASLFFNALFLMLQAQRYSYDAYSHIFLADHYRQRWWSLWEPRWYLGFSVASYPPLVHQLIALLSWPASALLAWLGPEPYPGAWRVLGEEIGYVVVLLLALALYPLAVEGLARIFFGPRAAQAAAWLAILLPGLSLSAWTFGQLPTIAATATLLLAMERGYGFLEHGHWRALAEALALAAVTGALHHGVFLLAPFVGGAVIWQRGVRERSRLGGLRLGARAALWAALSAGVVALVLWPFLKWSSAQALQTPIDHASRHNFLTDWTASAFFLWPMYGPLVLLAPPVVRVGLRARRWPALAALGALSLLGLGGTTPLPAWLFGAGWAWLTYDRFALWAATLLVMWAGALLQVWLRAPRWRWRSLALCLGLAVSAVLAGGLGRWLPTQPAPIEMGPLVRFLGAPQNRLYRYLTLGFGDQFARLSTLVSNGTPDGNYHTARALPELRASGLGAIDTALWTPQGVWAARPFLEHPERYGLRWVFAAHPDYNPVLIVTGWRLRGQMSGVTVWERADVAPRVAPTPRSDAVAAQWWGAVPLLTLAAAILIVWPRQRRMKPE